jgi:outer membrane usher protein
MNCLRRIKGLFALLVLSFGSAATPADSTHVLIVDLYVNHQRMGETFVLQDESGRFYVDESALLHWEISRPWPEPQQFSGVSYYGVHEFAGATAQLISRTMELRIFMPASLMPLRRMSMQNVDVDAQVEGYGAFMDYDLNWLNQGSISETSSYGLFRPVVFGPFGNISANVAYRDLSSSADARRLSVLELTYTRDDPERMRSLRVGDVYTTAPEMGRSLRIGGVQLATNFATRPTLITYPLPDFYGETAVPSALDIYINGRLSRSENVQPGSFVLDNVPVMNGAGQMQVVATDALGRQQVFTQDFYLSTELLMQGLSDYSFTLGALRENFGLGNFRYGKLAGSATWRHGLSDNLTVEGHGEFTEGLAMIGSAMQYGIKAGGTVSTGLGLSDSDAGTGVRLQLGFRRLTGSMHYNIGVSGSTEDFSLVGSQQSQPKLQVVSSIGKNFYENGSLQLSVVHQGFYEKPERTIWSVDYSKRIFGSLSMSSYISYLDAQERDLSAGFRFFVSFGNNKSASANISTSRNGTGANAMIQRSMPMTSGYGYHLGIGKSDNSFVEAGGVAQNEYGVYSVDVRSNEYSGTAWQVGTRGSIAYMAGMTRASRQVEDAFAVVSVGSLEGVRVYSENIEIGRTNESGKVFVPGLRPYLSNRLRIEVDDIPLNARIGETSVDTAPFYKSGVVVNFDVQVTTNVVFRAVLPDGTPLPEGAVAIIYHTGEKFPVGMDGKLFLQGIDRSSEIEIRWSGSVCDIDVPYPSGSAVIAKLGDIVCEPRKD